MSTEKNKTIGSNTSETKIDTHPSKELPTLNETIAIIQAEEGRRGVMVDQQPHLLDGTALVTKSEQGNFGMKEQLQSEESYLAKQGSKENLWCTFCKKPRHTKDQCWKLHGRPSSTNKNWNAKGAQSRNSSGAAHLMIQSSTNEGEASHGHSEFNKEDIQRLKALLCSLEKPAESVGNCSLALSGKVFTSQVENGSDIGSWLIDSGATDHMTYISNKFITYTPYPSNQKISTADGSLVTVAGRGDVQISPFIVLKNVLHVPKLSANLVSIQRLANEFKCNVIFNHSSCVFQEQGTGKMIGRARARDGLYYLEKFGDQNGITNHVLSSFHIPSSFLSEKVVSNKDKIWRHHFRFGHPSFSILKIMFPELFKGLFVDNFHCDSCELAKHRRASFPINNELCSTPFSLIHSDIWGPSTLPNVSGAKWFVSFIDDCSRVCWVFLLKQKSDVSLIFPIFHKMVKTQFGVDIKRIRSDNAKDYFNQVLSPYFQNHGIVHESSCVNTPQQNGVAERKNGHLLATTRALLFQNNVPKNYWGEAVLTSTHLINRIPSRVLGFKTPMQVLSSFYPDLNMSNKLIPRIFGCVSFVHVHTHQRGKLDPRALKCVFVGYSSTQKGYKCYHPLSKKFFVSFDVTFQENIGYFTQPYPQEEISKMENKDLFLLDLPFRPSPPLSNPSSSILIESEQVDDSTRPLQVYSRRRVSDSNPTHEQELEPEPVSEEEVRVLDSVNNAENDLDLPIAVRKKKRECTGRSLYPISQFVSYQNISAKHKSFLSHLNTITIPKSVSEALQDKEWENAMKVEMDALEKNGTWDLVDLPKGKTTVGCKWVFTVKYNADGSLERHKARLVAKGYTQTYGVDYLETFAPVAKMNTVRVLLSLAANLDWSLQQFDVKNAFLHGELEEEIYMDIPPGFGINLKGNKVCKLKKALYGLKQSPRAWFGRFARVMLSMGYKQSQGDHTLFIKHSASGGVTALLVYVDDIIVTGNDEKEKLRLKQQLAEEFEIKELGQLKYFLGIEVAHSKQGIFISQRKYVLDLLKETGKLGCKPVDSPIESNLKLGECEEDSTVDKGNYQRLVGRLIYLSHTRPDIAYAVSMVSQFMHNPKETHLHAVHRILQYLKGSPGKGLIFKKGSGLLLEAYTDADYAGSIVDRRSTSGYCTFLGGNLITWRSKKQSVVSRSSAESEFRAMALGVCELLWLRLLLGDLGIKLEKSMRLFCDNKSAISIAHNPVQHDRTKHIEVDRHFIKEKLDSGLICTPYIPSKDQLADILTKGLNGTVFQILVDKLGMKDIHSSA